MARAGSGLGARRLNLMQDDREQPKTRGLGLLPMVPAAGPPTGGCLGGSSRPIDHGIALEWR